MQCLKCSYHNPQHAKFCMECGAPLSKEASTEFIENSERKQVTILFSDMSGYTAMTERLDPEEVKRIMSEIFGEITKILSKYDGFIERFIGDAVMAVFGVPRTHEDDPVRAIQAAIEIHAMVDALNPKFEDQVGQHLRMHTGINTGLVVTGDVDLKRGTHGITGDAINLASRIEGLAPAGEILVGQSTYQMARLNFLFEPMPPTKVKGKTTPVAVFKVISPIAPDARSKGDRQVSSALVGRDREMEKLVSQLRKTVNGHGSVVNVIGEAGIGKSRLIAEWKQKEEVRTVTLLEGRAISIGKNLGFHPIINLLKQWAAILDDDTEAQAFAKIKALIRTVCPQQVDEILPFVTILMGMPLKGRHAQRVKGIKGESLEKLIFKNFRELLTHAAALKPVVFIMEDLHWADSSSLAFLESLQGLSKNHRLMFINLLRPGYLDKEWAGATDETRVNMALSPLKTEEGDALVHNMLQIEDLPHKIKSRILGRTEGNPFFIEEVVRSLIDEGAVIKKEGSFVFTDKINQVVIPPNINDLLMARIDRLEGPTRELLKIASVIGRSFFDLIIKEMAGSTIDQVDDRLAYLKEVQILKDRTRMQELEYMFKHALAREATYESTLLEQRRDLHLQVARAIEKIFQDRLHEFYGMLAFHYGKGEDLDKAGEYLAKAGEEALKASASSEAINYLKEALTLYARRSDTRTDPEMLTKFEKNIALACHNKSLWPESVAYLDKVLERWGLPIPKAGPFGIASSLLSLLVIVKAVYFRVPGSKKVPTHREKEAFDLYFKTIEALSYVDHTRQVMGGLKLFRLTTRFDISELPGVSRYWSGTAALFSVSGLSFQLGSRLMKMGKQYIDPKDVAGRLNHVVMSTLNYHCQGAWDKIRKFDENLMNAGLKIGDLWHTANYLIFSGLVQGEQGKFSRLQKAIELSDTIGETYAYSLSTIIARELKTELLLKIGSLSEAVTEADKGLYLSKKHNHEMHELIFLGYKAEAQQLSGDAVKAQATIAQAEKLYNKQSVMVLTIFMAPFVAARFLIDIERLRQAVKNSDRRQISSLCRQAGRSGKAALKNARKYAPYRTKILRLMGDYYWIIENQRTALRWWRKAIREGRRLGARPDIALTYLTTGKHLLRPQSRYPTLDGITAKTYLEKAGTLLEEMNLPLGRDS